MKKILISAAAIVLFLTACGSPTVTKSSDSAEPIFTLAKTVPSDSNGIFVSAANGDDANSGSMAAPLATIQKATNRAFANGKSVYVAGGVYDETVWLKTNIYCGYSDSTWTYSPSTSQTVINGVSWLGVYVNDDKTSEIDSCEINGPTSGAFAKTAGLVVRGTVTLTNSVVSGGDNSSVGGRTYGILAGSPSSCVLTLVNNLIKSGVASSGFASTGVVNRRCDITAVNNSIVTEAGAGYAIGFNSWSNAVSSVLVNNVINASDTSGEDWAIGIDQPSSVTLAGNVLLNIPTLPNALLVTQDASDIISKTNLIADVNNCAATAYCDISDSNSASSDIKVISFPNNLHLTYQSPAIAAGVDPASYYAGSLADYDVDGQHRPLNGGWDAGYDQLGVFPDSGQTLCYDGASEIACPTVGSAFYGQDAQYSGIAKSYTDMLDGTIVDNVTGLTWQQEDDNTKRTWVNAIDYCDNLVLGGAEDWRLPTLPELYSLNDLSHAAPYADSIFTNTSSGIYWTGETISGETNLAAAVNFSWGVEISNSKTNSNYVRCVRSATLEPKFVNNGNGTTTDLLTGLMWTNTQSASIYNWQNALAYCENLTSLGYTDWRLPSAQEASSILDRSYYNPAVDPAYFTITYDSSWTSTTVPNSPSNAARADFVRGTASSSLKTNSVKVLCVR